MLIDYDAYVGWALKLLRNKLRPVVEQQFEACYGKDSWRSELAKVLNISPEPAANGHPPRRDQIGLDAADIQALFNAITARWQPVFMKDKDQFTGLLNWRTRNLINVIRDYRNDWAHQREFSTQEAYQALNIIRDVLYRIGTESDELEERIRHLKRQLWEEVAEEPAALVPIEVPIQVATTYASVIIVAQDGSGQYTTISEAVRAARPHARIEVCPGHYTEGLVIDKPLEVIGIGRREDIVIQAKHVSCIEMRANEAKVQGLTLIYVVAEEEFGDDEAGIIAWNQAMCECAIDVSEGQLTLENCAISSYAEGIRVQGAVVMRECKLGEGIAIEPDARAMLEDCGITSAVTTVRSRGDLVMRRCAVRDGLTGIQLESGHARIEDCEIHTIYRSHPGITVDFCSAVIRDCRIHDIKGPGVIINGVEPDEFYELISLPRGPRCIMEDCEIHDTTGPALEVHGRTRAEFKRSTMRDSQAAGVYVGDYGRVTLEACTIRANARAGVEIASNSAPEIYNCVIEGGNYAGILAYENRDYAGRVESCEISRNAHAGIEIGSNGNLRVRLCRINGNGDAAVYAHDGATGFIAECDVRDNGDEPWQIEPGCRVHHERNVGGDD